MADSFFLAIDPILPYKLASEFGYKEHDVGIFFFYFTGVVVLFTFLFMLIPDKANKIALIVAGGFVITLGAFLTGPSQVKAR